jgi:hypothetical protein
MTWSSPHTVASRRTAATVTGAGPAASEASPAVVRLPPRPGCDGGVDAEGSGLAAAHASAHPTLVGGAGHPTGCGSSGCRPPARVVTHPLIQASVCECRARPRPAPASSRRRTWCGLERTDECPTLDVPAAVATGSEPGSHPGRLASRASRCSGAQTSRPRRPPERCAAASPRFWTSTMRWHPGFPAVGRRWLGGVRSAGLRPRRLGCGRRDGAGPSPGASRLARGSACCGMRRDVIDHSAEADVTTVQFMAIAATGVIDVCADAGPDQRGDDDLAARIAFLGHVHPPLTLQDQPTHQRACLRQLCGVNAGHQQTAAALRLVDVHVSGHTAPGWWSCPRTPRANRDAVASGVRLSPSDSAGCARPRARCAAR